MTGLRSFNDSTSKRITQTTPYDSPGTLAKNLGEIPKASPQTWAPNTGGVGSNRRFSTNISQYFSFTTTYTRGHAYKLYKSRPLTSIRKNVFCKMVIGVWNAVPADVVDFTSLRRFHSSILNIDLCSELKRF